MQRRFSVRSQAKADSAATIDDVLNLRDGAGTWAGVIDLMWQGEPVTVLDGPTGDGWYYVDYYGEQGWAYGGYLSIYGSTAWDGEVAQSSYGGVQSEAWVTFDSLNVRASGSLDADVIDHLSQGDEITVTGDSSNGFSPVDISGEQAWVWTDALSFDGPVAAGPEHWIDVNRSSHIVTLYVGQERAVASYYASLGWDTSDDGFYSTASGTYQVFSKYEGLSWTDWGGTYIEDWVGFDPSRDNGFHSYSMDSSGNVLPNGDGKTGGCVATAPGDAAENHAFATYGMRVEVHW